jgi:hypothetical protein
VLNRRTLFARLSAVALAPLAKLLPKPPEPEWYPTGWGADPGPYSYNWTAYPHSSPDRAEALYRCFNEIIRKQLGKCPSPQEEA